MVVLLFLTAALLFHYDPLDGVIDIRSVQRQVSARNATLTIEMKKMARENEMMARERALWEKAKEARMPQGAFWDVVWPAWDCRAYGKREYWGSLRNVPEGWDPMDACMNMPVEIKGVKIRRPDRCARVFVFPEVQIHGYWMVDWDQPDCKPWFRDFEDKVGVQNVPPGRPHAHPLRTFEQGCVGYNSGKRRIEAQIMGINQKGGQIWQLLCMTTPLVWDMTTYPSPAHCEGGVSACAFRVLSRLGLIFILDEQFWGKKVAVWEVPDESCKLF